MPYFILMTGMGAVLIGLGGLLGQRTGQVCLILGTVLAAVGAVLILAEVTAHGA